MSTCRYIGDNIKLLIERADGTYCFRLHKDRSGTLLTTLKCCPLKTTFTIVSNRVYYVSEKIMKLGSNVARENLISLGTCFGRFILIEKWRGIIFSSGKSCIILSVFQESSQNPANSASTSLLLTSLHPMPSTRSLLQSTTTKNLANLYETTRNPSVFNASFV